MLDFKISRRTFSSALLLPALAVGVTQAHAAATVGQAAPDFTATDALGKTHKLSDFKGKHVVLEWTNPGCPFVVKHYSGNMQALQKEFTAKGVVWLSVNSTSKDAYDYLPPAKLMAWKADKKANATAMLMDESGKIGQLYSAKTTPHMYIINPQGMLVYAGAIDSIPSARVDDIKTATNYVRQGLNEALGGKAISTPSTRAYGCSVKYKDA
ncbi:MAG: thioredoxin family protein [Polaromonas sp.]